MSGMRTWHVDAVMTGQVRTVQGACGAGASGTSSRDSWRIGLMSARRTMPVRSSPGRSSGGAGRRRAQGALGRRRRGGGGGAEADGRGWNTRPFEISLWICLAVAVAWRAGNRREPVRYWGCLLARASRPRGCSSMVEPQPSKLAMRVRFPSSALIVPWLVSHLIRSF
jgi:hypothetical protein